MGIGPAAAVFAVERGSYCAASRLEAAVPGGRAQRKRPVPPEGGRSPSSIAVV